MRLHLRDALQALFSLPHHGGNLVEHGENFFHATLVKHGYLHAMPYQFGGDIRLQV